MREDAPIRKNRTAALVNRIPLPLQAGSVGFLERCRSSLCQWLLLPAGPAVPSAHLSSTYVLLLPRRPPLHPQQQRRHDDDAGGPFRRLSLPPLHPLRRLPTRSHPDSCPRAALWSGSCSADRPRSVELPRNSRLARQPTAVQVSALSRERHIRPAIC